MLLTATIADVACATPRAVLVRAALDGPFPFAAGQAALVGLHGQPDRRPYSIAAGPAEVARDGLADFLVGVDREGIAGPHLPRLARGVRVDVEGPVGTFQLPDRPKERRFLFVAGGSGIAPLRAMVHEALGRGADWQLSLVYSARVPGEFAFDGEFLALADEGRLTYCRTATRHAAPDWTGRRGRITETLLESALAGPDTLCFVCGPESLVHDVPRMLQTIGIPEWRIRVEEWAARPAHIGAEGP